MPNRTEPGSFAATLAAAPTISDPTQRPGAELLGREFVLEYQDQRALAALLRWTLRGHVRLISSREEEARAATGAIRDAQ